MSIEDKAEYLDGEFNSLIKSQKEYIAKIKNLFLEWDSRLEPIKRVMKKYNIYFMNPKIAGARTLERFLIGKTLEIPCRLLVLKQGRVIIVNSKTDEHYTDDYISLEKFIETADLTIAKTGFDYVKELLSPADNIIAQKNSEFIDFLSQNADNGIAL